VAPIGERSYVTDETVGLDIPTLPSLVEDQDNDEDDEHRVKEKEEDDDDTDTSEDGEDSD
jgi:hypothetical protein